MNFNLLSFQALKHVVNIWGLVGIEPLLRRKVKGKLEAEVRKLQKEIAEYKWIDLIDFWCYNATFSNISAISWRPVLVVEEAGENHRPWESNW
jgi:hypothetical protein